MAESQNRRIAKNIVLLYCRMAIIMLIQLYISRIILDQLGQEGYGIYNVVGGLVVILTFLNGAMVSTTQRFLSFELGRKDFWKLRLTFSQSIYAHIAIAVLFVIVAETLGLWFLNTKMVIEPDLKVSAFWVYQFSIISLIISLLQVPFGALITSHERMDVYAYIGIVEIIFKLCIALFIGKFPFSNRLIWYAFLILLSTVIISLSYVVFCRIKYSETQLVFKIDKPIFKAITGFAGWSVLGSLAWIGKNQGVNVVLNLFFGATINAAYGIAVQINNAISSFVQNFIMSVNPQIIQSYANENYTRTSSLVTTGSKISFMLLFLIIFPIYVCMNDILGIWLVQVPAYTTIFARLVLIITLCESFTHVMGVAVLATGNIKEYQIIIGITLLLNLPIAYILLKRGFPPYSVLICGIVIALIGLAERIFILGRKVIGFSLRKFLYNSILPAIIVVLATFLVYGVINLFFKNEGWILRAIIALISVAISELLFGLNASERQRLSNYLIKLKIKIWTQ